MEKDKITIIGIAGGTGSGKTTVVKKSESVDRKGGQKTKVSIIRMIKDNPSISSIEMANLIGINRSAISKHLKKLKEDHIIKREGPAKGGKWIIITS